MMPPLPQSTVATPTQYVASSGAGVRTDALPTARWWQGFGDPVLVGLEAEAIAANRDLRSADARLRAARAGVGIASSARSPTVDGSLTGGMREDETAANRQRQPSEQSRFYQAGFDASWEIDVFGGIAASVAAADADAAAAAYARGDVLVSLLADVARNYIELRGAQARIDVAHRNIERQRDALELLTSRVRAGLSSEVDSAKARADLKALEAVVPALEESVQRAMYRLGVLIGREPGALVAQLRDPRGVPPAPPGLAVGLPSDLLERRPDVRRAQADVVAANARVGVARADLFPKFYLSGLLGRSSESTDSAGFGPGLFYGLGPTVTLPIFNGGRLRSRVEVRDAELAAALAAYEQSMLRALEDVNAALAGYAREQERRQSLSDALTAAELALKLARELYERGLADYFAVLDAERSLYAVEDDLTASTTAVSVKLIALYKALGGGWEDTAPALATNRAP